MYLLYDTQLRNIISVIESDLEDEEKTTYEVDGRSGIEVSNSDFPDGWPCELGNYYVNDSNAIVAANTYTDFANPISLTVGQTHTWTAIEDCQLVDITTGTASNASAGETVTFTATDPGNYVYNVRSKTYKEAFIEIGVSMP